MASVEDIFEWLGSFGIYELLIPFFLVFTLVFAFLQKVQPFGGGKSDGSGRRFNVIVAIIFGLLFVIPHATDSYPTSFDPVDLILDALPSVIVWIVAIAAVWILLAALGFELLPGGGESNWWNFIVGAFAIVVVSVIFLSSAGFEFAINLLETLGLDDPAVQQTLLIIAIVAGLMIFILGDDEKKNNNNNSGDRMKALGDFLGGLSGKADNNRRK